MDFAMQPLPPVGTRIRNRFNGETFIFTHMDDRADEVQFEVFLERGGMLTGTGRQHLHPNADEEFIVQAGMLRIMVDGAWRMFGPGESLVVTRGTPHLFRNGHDGETQFTAKFRPAHDFLRLFLNMSMNIADNPSWYDAKGEPPLFLQAQALHAFRGHAYGHGIPVWFQKLLFAVLSPIALLMGYRLAMPPRNRRLMKATPRAAKP
ncbi:cupin domain-containing protein [Mesorhizobium sp. IMUNJ 23232]|uniref:cupin domain-containing protein n=1 Tax=Mesorhizobium sp. IMUNJ 23232 TaxID=3376064 RepID=UPI00379481D0